MGRHFIVAIKPGHDMYTEYTIMHLQATGHSYIIRCGESMQYYVKPDLQLWHWSHLCVASIGGISWVTLDRTDFNSNVTSVAFIAFKQSDCQLIFCMSRIVFWWSSFCNAHGASTIIVNMPQLWKDGVDTFFLAKTWDRAKVWHWNAFLGHDMHMYITKNPTPCGWPTASTAIWTSFAFKLHNA